MLMCLYDEFGYEIIFDSFFDVYVEFFMFCDGGLFDVEFDYCEFVIGLVGD